MVNEQLKIDISEICQKFDTQQIINFDKKQSFNRPLWADFGQKGMQGLCIPKRYGGNGLDIATSIFGLKEIGYQCQDNGLSFAVGAHLLAGVVPIWLYGTEEQKTDLLPDLCNGKTIIANAISEPQGGSDVFNMNTVATKEGEYYVINGQKTYCSNAPVADNIILYAMTNPEKGMFGGVSAFLLSRTKGHFTTTDPVDKMGLRSCLMSDVLIQNIKVSSDQLLGKEGGGAIIFNRAMTWERIGLSALHLGTLNRIFDNIIQWMNQRRSFGQSLSKYQALSHKIVNIKIEIDACQLLLTDAITQLEQNSKKLDLAASILKLKTSELYKKAAVDILQIAGANGYINNSYFERTARDAMASTLYSGSSEIQRNIIARKIGLK